MLPTTTLAMSSSQLTSKDYFHFGENQCVFQNDRCDERVLILTGKCLPLQIFVGKKIQDGDALIWRQIHAHELPVEIRKINSIEVIRKILMVAKLTISDSDKVRLCFGLKGGMDRPSPTSRERGDHDALKRILQETQNELSDQCRKSLLDHQFSEFLRGSENFIRNLLGIKLDLSGLGNFREMRKIVDGITKEYLQILEAFEKGLMIGYQQAELFEKYLKKNELHYYSSIIEGMGLGEEGQKLASYVKFLILSGQASRQLTEFMIPELIENFESLNTEGLEDLSYAILCTKARLYYYNNELDKAIACLRQIPEGTAFSASAREFITALENAKRK